VIQNSDVNKISNYIKGDKASEEELARVMKILKLLGTSFDVNYQIKMSIVRGLDYYKGIVFEIEAPSLGAEKQICGGGAYELIPLFGGRETPTAGFALGFDRTILALEIEKYNLPSPKLDFYVIPINEDMISKSIEIVQKLRGQGASVDVDLLRRGVGKSLKYASSINTKKAILKAVENPRSINYNLVNAQQARRVLDRLVGYKLSPVLWKKVKSGLSAGRVQSVAVRLIVEKEREIEGFKPQASYKVIAEFTNENGKSFRTKLTTSFKTRLEAEAFLKSPRNCFSKIPPSLRF